MIHTIRFDLIYQSESDGIQVAIGTSSSTSNYVFKPFSDFLLTDADCMSLNSSYTISIPNSNAFIDLDGDCMPDLFLTMTDSTNTSYYSVFVQRLVTSESGIEHKYCLTSTQD